MYHQAWGGDRTLWSSWGVGELDQWATDQAKGEMRGLAQAELAAGPAGAGPIRAQRASRGAAHLDPVGRELGTGTAIQPLSGWGGGGEQTCRILLHLGSRKLSRVSFIW